MKEGQWPREDGCLFPGPSLLEVTWDARKFQSSLSLSKQQNPLKAPALSWEGLRATEYFSSGKKPEIWNDGIFTP